VGSDPASSFHRIWEELGALQGRTMLRPEEYMRIQDRDGTRLTIFADINRTEAELRELAPEDKDLIDEFTAGVREFSRINIPVKKAPELRSLVDNVKLLPMMFTHMRTLSKWGGISIGEYADRFKSDFLRRAFALLWYPRFAMSFLLAALGWMHRGVCGYPLGGSLAFSKAIEERYRLLGGEVHYGRRVKKILVEEDRAVGVSLDDGEEVRSDCVISAADGRSTIYAMLEGRFAGKETQGYYDNLSAVPSVVQVALGVNRLFEDIPCSAMGLTLLLNAPKKIAGLERTSLLLHVYGHDPNLAPEGRTLVKVTLVSDISHWEKLLTDPQQYDEAKKEVGHQVLACLDEHFPGIRGQVEMVDIATPVTFQRYTGNWGGSISGWMIRPDNWRLRIKRTLPGLGGFYMAGHWVDPIGVSMAALSGRNAIQLICREDRRRFGATVP